MLVTHIGPYHIGQKISDARGVEEYTEEEYEHFASAGAPRTFDDEQFYYGENVTFAGIEDWVLTIGTIKGYIYKFGLVKMNYSSSIAKKDFGTVKAYLNTVGENPQRQSFLSKNMTWTQHPGRLDLALSSMIEPGTSQKISAVVVNVTSADILRKFNVIP